MSPAVCPWEISVAAGALWERSNFSTSPGPERGAPASNTVSPAAQMPPRVAGVVGEAAELSTSSTGGVVPAVASAEAKSRHGELETPSPVLPDNPTIRSARVQSEPKLEKKSAKALRYAECCGSQQKSSSGVSCRKRCKPARTQLPGRWWAVQSLHQVDNARSWAYQPPLGYLPSCRAPKCRPSKRAPSKLMSSTAAAETRETRTRKRLPAARPARVAPLRTGRMLQRLGRYCRQFGIGDAPAYLCHGRRLA